MNSRAYRDLTGEKFERLMVIKSEGKDKLNNILWLCLCDCGKEKIVTSSNLRRGMVKSCGCLQSDCGKEKSNNLTHNRDKHNTYELFKDYGVGYFHNTNNMFLFDIEDYDKIKEICWHENGNGYACHKSKKNLFVHRIVINAKENEIVDHINRNRLDNRKSNLRIVSSSENIVNSKLRRDNTSGIKGVSWNKRYQRWSTSIQFEKKTYF